MSVTSFNLSSDADYEALQHLAANLGLYRLGGPGAGKVGSFPELCRKLGDQDAKVIASAIIDFLPSDAPTGEEDRKVSVSNLTLKQSRTLREIARLCKCLQTRGVGKGRTGNISILFRKMASNPDAILTALEDLDIEWIDRPIENDGQSYRTIADMARELGITRQAAWQRLKQ